MALEKDYNQNEYHESDIQKIRQKEASADEVKETQELGDLIKSEIIGAILGQSAREKWENKLESARGKGIDGLKAVRQELAEWKQAKETYMALFSDSEVWREETIEEYAKWLEDLTPREIGMYHRMWETTQYKPRRELVDKYNLFPKPLQDKAGNRDFFDKGFSERKEIVTQMEKEQIKEFKDKINKSSFSEKDKKNAINAFTQADLATRALHTQQLATSIEASDNQVKESKKLFKELTKYCSHIPADLKKLFEEGTFEDRQEVIATLKGKQEGKGLIKYSQELNKYLDKGFISKKTKQEYEKWATRDIAINAGSEGVLWALNELPNQMYDREQLHNKFDNLTKECQGIIPDSELQKEKKDFESEGYHGRLEKFEALHTKINELKKSLNLSENIPTSVRGLLTAAENVFDEALQYTEPNSRKSALELARNSYETIKKFAQENKNPILLNETESKIKEIDDLLEGKATNPEQAESETKRTAFESLVKEKISNSAELQKEAWYLTLMKYTVKDAKLKALQSGSGTQAKRAENQLKFAHHKDIQNQLQDDPTAENEVYLDEEGQAQDVTEIDVSYFGTSDPDKNTQSLAEETRKKVATNESDRVTAHVKFIDEDGREILPEEAEEALTAREQDFEQNLIDTMINEPRAQKLFPDSQPEDTETLFTEYIQSMREHGKLAADIFREQAKSV